MEKINSSVNHLEGTVHEEAQAIKEQLGKVDQSIRNQLEGEAKTATQEVQNLRQELREEAHGIRDQLGGEMKSTTQEVQN